MAVSQSNVIRFVPNDQMTVATQAVYLKDSFTGPWVAQPELWCSNAVWNVGTSMSTASLRHRYGSQLSADTVKFATRAPLKNKMRWYVRVVFTATGGVREWTGVIEVELDEQHGPLLSRDNAGNLQASPTGRNHLVAYGWESILARSHIDRSMVGQQGEFVPRALPFNPGLAEVAFNPDTVVTPLEGNRSLTLTAEGVYCFHYRRSGGEKWTTKTAVEYLLKYCTERDASDNIIVPFKLSDTAAALPNWDTPIEQCEGSTVYELLNRLIARQRGLGWYAKFVSDTGGDSIQIKPFTFLDLDLQIDETRTLKANPNIKQLAWEKDRGADPALKRSELDRADQVIVRGERRTTTATFSFMDGTLTTGWPADLETAYEAGGSASGAYPSAANVDGREMFDRVARSADKFKPVYTRFVPDDPMSPFVKNGLGGASTFLLPTGGTPPKPAVHAPEDQRFLPWLPLLEGYTYDGDAIDSGNPPDNGAKPAKRMQPLVFFRRPPNPDDSTDRWQPAEGPGATAMAAWSEHPFSAHVRVDNEDGALWVSLLDGYNHLIASADFSPLATDYTQFLANFRTDMIATLAVPWSEYVEGKYPATPTAGIGGVRRLIIEVPNYRLDYVAPNTVVGLDVAGLLLRSDAGGFIRDDRDELKAIARIAYEWYGKTRRALSFSTSLIDNSLQLGDFIVSIGDPDLAGASYTEDIRSAVTQIAIAMPLAEGQGNVRPAIPRISYETAFGELDALKLAKRQFR